jgi:hypothetical protein
MTSLRRSWASGKAQGMIAESKGGSRAEFAGSEPMFNRAINIPFSGMATLDDVGCLEFAVAVLALFTSFLHHDKMTDLRLPLIALVVTVVSFGTRYSIRHSMFLDTSNPNITHTHHLSNTHYFASKTNPLNTLFLKLAWGWTTLVFIPLLLTAPTRHRLRRAFQYLVATLSWLTFTTWFFGPALLERFIFMTGGVCVATVGNNFSLPIPVEYCFNREPISVESHPHLFPSSLQEVVALPTMPRLRRGHDVSGHIFLLTLSVLFLGDQVRQSLAQRRVWSVLHGYAITATGGLMALWLFSLWITSVYFHTAAEKFSGMGACIPSLSYVLNSCRHRTRRCCVRHQPAPRPTC